MLTIRVIWTTFLSFSILFALFVHIELLQENKNKITTNTQPNYEGTSNFEPTRDEKTSSNKASDNIQYETTERNIDKHTFNSEIDESHLAPNINKEIVQIEDSDFVNEKCLIHSSSRLQGKHIF